MTRFASWLFAKAEADEEEEPLVLGDSDKIPNTGVAVALEPTATDTDGSPKQRQDVQNALTPQTKRHRNMVMFVVVTGLLALSMAVLGVALAVSQSSHTDLALQSQNQADTWIGWDKVEKLFIFGDSYSDTRFDPFSDQPSPSNPMGNPAFPGTTSSRGPNWVDYLVTKYNKTFVETYNLAWGGTTINWDLVGGFPMAPDFRHRITNTFIPHYVKDPLTKWEPESSLFAIFFGINDITHSFHAENKTLHGLIFETYTALLDQLHEAGARNFVLFNVPPIDLTPDALIDGPEAQALEAQAIQDFNRRHAKMAKNLRTNYPNTTVMEIDTHTLFSGALSDPSSVPQTSGFKNTTDYCLEYSIDANKNATFLEECWLPINEYFWVDGLHPTFPVHEALAIEVARVLNE